MSIVIRYYSRGGNTEKLAKAAGEALGIPAKSVTDVLTEKADILLLGCSYYAFDMDKEVKKFIADNKDMIGTIVLFGTSAMMKSMKKPLEKVLKELGADIAISKEEFHCAGSFGPMHKGRPNQDDLAKVMEFARKFQEN